MALRPRVLLAAAVVAPLALATACGGSANAAAPAAPAAGGGGIPSGPAPGTQSPSETGSTLLAPLMVTWAQAYHQQHPQDQLAPDRGRQIALVDQANVRLRTWA